MAVGFLGLGHMGEAMAANLVRAGVDLTVWNRSAASLERITALGGREAPSAREALRGSAIALLMLANEGAIDAVLERGSPEFHANVGGRTIVHMGTTAPAYSRRLAEDVLRGGGRYVEAPVSGSRTPAENGTLVGMLAGEPDSVAEVRSLLGPICRQTFVCGQVPGALTMKLAVNLFLITMVTGLMEAAHFAANADLDVELFRSIVDAGPMASDVSRVKLDKLVRSDFGAQAGLADVLMNSRLIADAARSRWIATPLLDQALQLFAEAEAMGLGAMDMIGVSGAIEALTSERRVSLSILGKQ